MEIVSLTVQQLYAGGISVYVTGPAKIGHVAHEFCLLFQTSLTHNFLYQNVMAMKLLAISKNLIGFMMQVTGCKYSVSVLRYDL